MLEIGSFASGDCQKITRRAFLRAGVAAPFLPLAAWGASAQYVQPRARSVILLWLGGAPSHLDTFDPKPTAPLEYRGPFASIATRTPGVRFAEILPRLAERSHRFVVIRSHRNFDSDHLKAGTIALTGVLEQGFAVAPNFGAIVARQQSRGVLPAFMAIGRGSPRDVVGIMKGYGGGIWGHQYDPVLVHCDPLGQVDIPAFQLLPDLSPAQLQARRQVLQALDRVHRKLDAMAFAQWNALYERAYALLTAPETRRALDLSREPQKVRERYGQTAFGQSCLLARRLVEAGVPYVQVNWSQYVEAMTPNCDFGWDTHIYNFELLADRHGPILDRAFAALLDDLQERGLLSQTLVLCMGEFGRTPRINAQASRDHWPNVYASIWAGAGIEPGRVLGESDRRGEEPLTEPITPPMVGTTILELMGITSEMRSRLGVLPNGRVIHELIG